MQLVLALVLALLGCACTQNCDYTERVHSSPEPMTLAAALQRVDADAGACRVRCCALSTRGCDTFVLEQKEDGHAQCHLLSCRGACSFRNDDSGLYKVFIGVHAPGNTVHAEPMVLRTGTRTEDPTRTSTNTSDVCALPRVVGVCKAAFLRFFFDSKSGSCRQFIYGGCGANANNFETLQDCEKTCRGDQRDGCAAAPDTGPCRAAFSMFYFDPDTQSCKKFLYGGCRGNANRYSSESECLETCRDGEGSAHSQVKGRNHWTADGCAAAPDTGPCRAAFSMFYFDPDTQSCKKFLYGGCRGNANRYSRESECLETCRDGEGSAHSQVKGRNRWTAAFFMFLTLGAVSFLLVTALVFITIRRHHSSPRHALSIRSDKEELLNSFVDSSPETT